MRDELSGSRCSTFCSHRVKSAWCLVESAFSRQISCALLVTALTIHPAVSTASRVSCRSWSRPSRQICLITFLLSLLMPTLSDTKAATATRAAQSMLRAPRRDGHQRETAPCTRASTRNQTKSAVQSTGIYSLGLRKQALHPRIMPASAGLPQAVRCFAIQLLDIVPSPTNKDAKHKLVDFIFAPDVWKASSDMLEHEKPGKRGTKRGAQYYWVIRQLRRLAEPHTPVWYGRVLTKGGKLKRDIPDTQCVHFPTEYAQKILNNVPEYDPRFEHDALEQSEDFRKFDALMQNYCFVLKMYAGLRPEEEILKRQSAKRANDPCMDYCNEMTPTPKRLVVVSVPGDESAARNTTPATEALSEPEQDECPPNDTYGVCEIESRGAYRCLGAEAAAYASGSSASAATYRNLGVQTQSHSLTFASAPAPASMREELQRHIWACASMFAQEAAERVAAGEEDEEDEEEEEEEEGAA